MHHLAGRKPRGNALFLILIAVAFFAALAYAVTQSGRGGSGGVNRETEALAAAQVVQFANSVSYAVQRTLLTQNATQTQLFFNNNVYQSYGSTAFNGTIGSPADPSLYIFHPQGGGVTPITFVNAATGSCTGCGAGHLRPGHFLVYWTNIPGVGTSAPELALAGAQFSNGICSAINQSMGIATLLPDVTLVPGNAHTNGGAMPSPAAMGGSDIAAVTGQQTFCFITEDAQARSIFIHVLQVN